MSWLGQRSTSWRRWVRLRADLDAMDRSLSMLERQDVTRLGQRVGVQERRLDGIEVRLERIELRLGLDAT